MPATAHRHRRRSIALLVALLVTLGLAGPGAAAQGVGIAHRDGSGPSPEALFELTILHVNDGESALLPTEELPGAARFVAELHGLQWYAERGDGTTAGSADDEQRNRGRSSRRPIEGRAALTISSGDNFLAGPRLSASLADPDAFYDALVYTTGGFDAMTVGNHEFDFGPDVLADFIEATDDIPFISANLDVSAEDRLQTLVDKGRLAASTVVEKGGRQIGVVGATTSQLPSISSPRDVVVADVLSAVQAEVDALAAQDVGIIVLSSHLQDIDEELALVAQLRGVDAVVGGGGGEDIGDSYPLEATDAEGRNVPVVTTPGQYADIGRLVLHIDQEGEVVDVDEHLSGLVAVPLVGRSDRFVQAAVEAPVADYVAALDANIIATTEVPLDGRRQEPGVRDRETNLGSLFADALVATARDRADEFGVLVADIGLQNGGGMRQEAVIEPGPVTELDTFDIAAFANFVAVAQVDGTALRSALERSVSALPGAAGFHGQWAGVRFTFDASRPAQQVTEAGDELVSEGERIVDAIVTRADGTTVTLVADGELVAPDEVFTIAAADFLLGGGDGYVSLDQPYTVVGVTYQQALADRLAALATVTADQYPDVSVAVSTYTRFGPDGTFSLG